MQHMYNVNGVVTLGSYPFSEFGMKAPIEWIVLSRQPDTVLLVSRCALDGQPFHTNGQRMIFDPETRRIQARGEEASWERSSLYTWLNTDFYLSTFTPKERECILPADTPYRAGSGKLGHVFLLGVDEVNALFVSDESACCAPTPYARTRYEDSTEELRQQQAMPDAPLPARATYWLLSGKAACNQVPGARGPIVFALDQTEKRAVRPAILLDVRKHQALVEATRNAPGSASRRAAYQPPQPEAEPIAMPRQNLLGLLALDPANWVPIVTDMAEKDQPDAQMHLCSLYREGSGGLPQDPARSLEWCRRAADNGLAIAQALMGTHYYNGDGVPMDKREAVRWYRLAAEQGLAPAQGDLADCYLTGSGVNEVRLPTYLGSVSGVNTVSYDTMFLTAPAADVAEAPAGSYITWTTSIDGAYGDVIYTWVFDVDGTVMWPSSCCTRAFPTR